jgi:hypothetical protein
MDFPASASCLIRPYCDKPHQKGGTLICEGVHDLSEHERRLADWDSYRPPRCLNCGQPRLDCHDFRTRLLRGDWAGAATQIRRYRCVECGAVWQVLPALLARCLHRRWTVVQSALVQEGELSSSGSERRVSIPGETVRRWVWRIRLSAQAVIQGLCAAGAQVGDVLQRLSTECSRCELVEALVESGLIRAAQKLEQLASWVHRVVPGLRLM